MATPRRVRSDEHVTELLLLDLRLPTLAGAAKAVRRCARAAPGAPTRRWIWAEPRKGERRGENGVLSNEFCLLHRFDLTYTSYTCRDTNLVNTMDVHDKTSCNYMES